MVIACPLVSQEAFLQVNTAATWRASSPASILPNLFLGLELFLVSVSRINTVFVYPALSATWKMKKALNNGLPNPGAACKSIFSVCKAVSSSSVHCNCVTFCFNHIVTNPWGTIYWHSLKGSNMPHCLWFWSISDCFHWGGPSGSLPSTKLSAKVLNFFLTEMFLCLPLANAV